MNMKRQGDKQSLFFYVGLLRIVNEYDYARKLAKKADTWEYRQKNTAY